MSSEDFGKQAYQRIMLSEYQEAVNILNKGIAKHPSDYKLYINRCFSLIKMREFTSAMNDAQKLISFFPFIPNGFFLRGEIYMKTNKYAEAEKDFNKLLEMMNVDEYLNEISDKLYDCKMQQILQKGYDPHLAKKALRLAQSTKEALTLLGQGAIKNGEDCRELNFNLTEEEEKFFQKEFDKLENDSWITMSSKPKPTKKGRKEEHLDPKIDPANPGKFSSLWVVGREFNLCENISQKHTKDLEQLFGQFGSLRNVNVCPDKKCIFVNYTSSESAGKAMKELQDYNYRNVTFQIEYSIAGYFKRL